MIFGHITNPDPCPLPAPLVQALILDMAGQAGDQR